MLDVTARGTATQTRTVRPGRPPDLFPPRLCCESGVPFGSSQSTRLTTHSTMQPKNASEGVAWRSRWRARRTRPCSYWCARLGSRCLGPKRGCKSGSQSLKGVSPPYRTRVPTPRPRRLRVIQSATRPRPTPGPWATAPPNRRNR